MILIAIGGFLGAVTRFWISSRLNKSFFPFGTMFVNGTGSFLLGLLLAGQPAEQAVLLWGTGFLSAFTTFSTWLFEVKNMDGKAAVLYVTATCTLGLLGAWAGLQFSLLT